MTDRIRHRGPDAGGVEIFEGARLVLGHRRLSIVDLSPTGAQPMRSASGRYSVVFNGEVYNFRQIRDELYSKGHRFRGTSDTEVMLALIDSVGVEAATVRFAGMFAFALWDSRDETLWLARDRMGEKPLYYCQFSETFAFASELKALRALPNTRSAVSVDAILDVLERGYIRGDRTIYRDVSKLPPGSLMRVTRRPDGYVQEIQRYWSVGSVIAHPSAPGAEAAVRSQAGGGLDELDQLLCTVVRDEMIADVPIGAFLSGGIDSSLIVAVMQRVADAPVNTFTVGFEEGEFDESRHASAVAAHLGTHHTEIRLDATSALNYVDRLPSIFDEPFADSSQLPTLLVCEATRRHVTVALSGDGGDELFGGYPQYSQRDTIGRIAHSVPAFARTGAASLVELLPSSLAALLGSRSTWPPNSRARLSRSLRSGTTKASYETLLSEWVDPYLILAPRIRSPLGDDARWQVPWPSAASIAEEKMLYDMQTYLPDDILVKVDRSAMSVSLETRAPFLDHRVVEFAARQPLSAKIAGGTGKVMLRQLLSRYLPEELWQRPKRGFAVPLASWLRRELRPWAESMLTPDALLIEWFDPKGVAALWRSHLAGQDHAYRLWRVLTIMQWMRICDR